MTQLHAETLSQALAQARQESGHSGHVWSRLLAALQGDAPVLSQALLSLYDIDTLSADDLDAVRQVRSVANVNDALLLSMDSRSVLLCRDPWSPSVSLALAHGRAGRARLALAQPDQLEKLHEKLSGNQETTAKGGGARDASAVGFVDQTIAKARAEGASDIHFECDRKGLQVKLRLDGVMCMADRLDDPVRAEEVISRIKVMAQLDITERRRPQDGRIHWQFQDFPAMDLRASIMPSIFGEDAVLRLLDKAQLQGGNEALTLRHLGFDEEQAQSLRALATRPHGMLLMTGPTGSGKTTTVYAALSEVNSGLEKIVTIEDPVEYELPGVLQIPVNEQKGLTFATGLRSILRHDPDKILVGEIRDAETAQIAVQSALTGHLVFTTVHANSLFDVLGRFRHFGIEPFALASALNAVVVQRLLRALCPHCAGARPTTPEEAARLQRVNVPTPSVVPLAKGCAQCRGTGYKGRFVVAEVHELNDHLRDLMIAGSSVSELKSALYVSAQSTLLAKALAHVQAGKTSLEEVSRVVGLV